MESRSPGERPKSQDNPAVRINIDLKARSSEKRRGYSDEEARIVLQAARREKETHRRWVPWVCAYTGARISKYASFAPRTLRRSMASGALPLPRKRVR